MGAAGTDSMPPATDASMPAARAHGTTRRAFLRHGAGGVAALGTYGLLRWAPRAQAADVALSLFITEGEVRMVDGTRAFMLSYATAPARAAPPGPLISVLEGDRLSVSLTNATRAPRSFTIDGIADSGSIPPGETRVVRFDAPAAGTYLYADSVQEPVSRVLGLHGALISMPGDGTSKPYPGGPEFARQLTWMLLDVDPVWCERLRSGRAIDPASFLPRHFTINGRSGIDALEDPEIVAHGRVGEATLIRMLNAGLAVHSPHFHGNHVRVLAHNARVLGLQMLKDTVMMAAGDRKDVLLPFEPPPDAVPPVTRSHYPMHCHAEMSQTAAGGLYPNGMLAGWTLEG